MLWERGNVYLTNTEAFKLSSARILFSLYLEQQMIYIMHHVVVFIYIFHEIIIRARRIIIRINFAEIRNLIFWVVKNFLYG